MTDQPVPPVIRTNRDFYLAISALSEEIGDGAPSLEEYLRALRAIAQTRREVEAFSLADMFDLLRGAFSFPPPAFDESWRALTIDDLDKNSGFRGWETLVLLQIVDLREMSEAGILDREHLYFGVDAPRGGRWYNFDPCTYLECATAGSIGGWEEGDPTGRSFVSGRVAVLDGNGGITDADPRELRRPEVELPVATWDMFREFLECGQWYE